MAKLYFKFGAMGSSKTAQALMTKFNYEEKDKHVLLVKPSTDNRDDVTDETGRVHTIVRSRIGLFQEAVAITAGDSMRALFENENRRTPLDVIIVDEAQFLTVSQVNELKDLADFSDIPVLCFGLRTDFQTKMFPGSKRLLEIADSITEIKSICRCGRKATVNARFDGSGEIITEGSQVLIGGNDRYVGMCYKCYVRLIEEKGKSKEFLNRD
jgi:thymidine kinase